MTSDENVPTAEAIPLLEPRDGMPPLVASTAQLDWAVAAMHDGVGPVAVKGSAARRCG